MINTNEQTIKLEVEFDFDVLMDLAKNDPEQFEEIRHQIIADYIKTLPEERRHRMECLQWRIDRTREKSKNALSSCMAITEMMWESFEQLNALFVEMKRSDSTRIDNVALPTADIIPFKTA